MQDIIGHIITFLAGLGAGVVIKIRFDSSKRKNSVTSVARNSQGAVNQSGNKVGGNMSGRDTHVTRD